MKSSLNSANYGGAVELQAHGRTVVLGPKVILTGRDHVTVYALGDIALGAGSSFVSRGGSANLGTVSLFTQQGDITLSSQVKFSTLREIFMTAVDGDVVADPGLRLDASQGMVFVDGRRVVLNAGQFRADGMAVTGDGVPLQFKNNRVTIDRSGFFLIRNPGSSVDITGTTFSPLDSFQIDAAQVID